MKEQNNVNTKFYWNKRATTFSLIVVTLILLYFGLEEINSSNGHYRSIEFALKHEYLVQQGAEELLTLKGFENTPFVSIVYLNEQIEMYSVEQVPDKLGKNYVVQSKYLCELNYNTAPNICPPVKDWFQFVTNINNQNLYWTIVQKDCTNINTDDFESIIYKYNGKEYRFMYFFIKNGAETDNPYWFEI